MDLSKTVYAIIGVLVAVLIVATVAVPVIQNAQMEESVVFNNGTELNYHASLDDGFEMSKSANATSVVVNGTTYPSLGWDNYLLLSNVATIMLLPQSQGVSVSSSDGQTNVAVSSAFSASISGTTLTYSIDGVSNTIENLTSGFVISTDGDYVTANAFNDYNTYVNDVEDISLAYYNGNINEFVVMIQGEDLSINEGALAVTLEPVDGYVDLYKIPKGGITVTDGDSIYSGAHVIVPAKIYAHTPEQSSNVALLGAALLMLFLVPLMMVVNMIRGRSD